MGWVLRELPRGIAQRRLNGIHRAFSRAHAMQRNTFIACFLGWSLDAFDFFILTFCVTAIAAQFQTRVATFAEAVFITLAFRPVGAFLSYWNDGGPLRATSHIDDRYHRLFAV